MKNIISAALAASLAAVSVLPVQARGIYHKGWIDFNKNGRKDIYEDPSRSRADRVEDLLSQMTVEEKTCQLATLYGYCRVLPDSLPNPETWPGRVWKDGIANIDEMHNGVGNGYFSNYDMIWPYSNHVKTLHAIQKWFVEETRLGIPAEFSNEGIHGLNHTKATPLPAPIAIGSTWDRELVHKAGQIAGHEAKLIGYHSVYAPILDVARDPRWGRIVECYGEDPYLISELGVQMSSGIQESGVASGLKHFAAYSMPKGGRDGQCRTDPHINPRELHEMYLYPFAKVIRQAHPWEIMSSYNDWNGEPVSASHYFLTELLRETYGFDGYVVSDSQAVEYVYTKHEVAPTYEDAIRQVLEAGLNVHTNFHQPEEYIEPLREGIKSGLISMDVVDQRVREVLDVKFRLGLFDNPYTGDGKLADAQAGAQYNEDFTLQMAREAVVLLKNEDSLLPLDRSKVRKVLVAGPLADDTHYMTSRYGPNGIEGISMYRGIKDYLGESAEVVCSKGCNVVDKRWPESEILPEPMDAEETAAIEEAVSAAQGADVIVAVLGEDDYIVGESHSRTSLDLPGRQQQLLEALYRTGKPVVLVLVNGRPLTVNWADKHIPAIVEMWFPAYQGGQALAETLFGDNNPSGKLTVTFPKTIGEIEYNFPFKKGSHNGQPRNGDPNGSGYTRIGGSLYPFGYGLSYTTFEYSSLQVSKTPAGDVEVSFDISNTGSREGTEVAQLYIRDEYSSVVTYDSVLRGFERVSLRPGETKRVHFTVTPEDLQILDKQMQWTVEPGDFLVKVGSSSEDIRLTGSFSM